MYVRMCVCMYVCMYVCMMYMYVYSKLLLRPPQTKVYGKVIDLLDSQANVWINSRGGSPSHFFAPSKIFV